MNENHGEKETHGNKASPAKSAIGFFSKEIDSNSSGALAVVDDTIRDSTRARIAAHIAQGVVE